MMEQFCDANFYYFPHKYYKVKEGIGVERLRRISNYIYKRKTKKLFNINNC